MHLNFSYLRSRVRRLATVRSEGLGVVHPQQRAAAFASAGSWEQALHPDHGRP